MSSGSPSPNRHDPGGAHRFSAFMASLITPLLRRRVTDDRHRAHAARPASTDGSGIDSLAYQQWLHHLHRTTADTFDDDSTEI